MLYKDANKFHLELGVKIKGFLLLWIVFGFTWPRIEYNLKSKAMHPCVFSLAGRRGLAGGR